MEAQKQMLKALFNMEKDIKNISDSDFLRNICINCILTYESIIKRLPKNQELEKNLVRLNAIKPRIIQEDNLSILQTYAKSAISMLKKSKVERFL